MAVKPKANYLRGQDGFLFDARFIAFVKALNALRGDFDVLFKYFETEKVHSKLQSGDGRRP